MSTTQPQVSRPTTLQWPHTRDIHVVALVPSTMSLLAALIGIYWFCTMQRNFRRTLILVLILADASKSLWIFVFNIVGLALHHTLDAHSPFCQLGGFCLQMSFEAGDLAILFLTLHIVLQVIRPRWFPRSDDGLYHVRHWIITANFILPAINAAIPFTRYPSNPGYTYDGAYCSLFTGPRWYALGLSWIPRYLIWLCVLCSIASIYVYSRSQAVRRRQTILPLPQKHIVWRKPPTLCRKLCQQHATDAEDLDHSQWQRRRSSDLSVIGAAGNRPKRQIRKLIAYPLMYITAWSVPFSAQVVSYTTTQNINNVYPLRAASVFAVSSLGFLDVVIFCWREKPWQYSSRGDGTIVGSLRLPTTLQSPFGSRRPSVIPSASLRDPDDILGIGILPRPRKTHIKGSDSQYRQAVSAYERLALERAAVANRPPMSRTCGSQTFEDTLAQRLYDLNAFSLIADTDDGHSEIETEDNHC